MTVIHPVFGSLTNVATLDAVPALSKLLSSPLLVTSPARSGQVSAAPERVNAIWDVSSGPWSISAEQTLMSAVPGRHSGSGADRLPCDVVPGS